MQPQVDGNLVNIFVKSGDLVRVGQVLMRIDPLKQMATVQSQQGTQAQKKAIYDYSQIQFERQRKLFESGVVSRDAYDQATQAYQNAKADYESNAALTDTQKQQLAYYDIRAPLTVRAPSSPRRERRWSNPGSASSLRKSITACRASSPRPKFRAPPSF